jgi:hypothetical protein
MPEPAAEAFSRRIHQAILPVTERYVRESGRPDQVYAAQFDPDGPLFDYAQTHFAARPAYVLTEQAGRFVTAKIVGVPNSVLDEILVPAFAKRADEIIEHRLERPQVQLADHMPVQLPVATQFAGNLALANRVQGLTKGSRMRGLIRQSHGIGTVGYRPLGVRLIPKGPGILIGKFGQRVTNTHYSIPATPQYYDLDMERDDRKQYNGPFGLNLIRAMQLPPEALPQTPTDALLQDPIGTLLHRNDGKVRPANLHPECVISPVGTKELVEDGRVVIPRAHRATGMLVDGLSADIVPVYTSFKLDGRGKIIGGYCEVGEVIPAPKAGEGVTAVDTYLTNLAAFRSEREDREVVYADAA